MYWKIKVLVLVAVAVAVAVNRPFGITIRALCSKIINKNGEKRVYIVF